MYRLLTVGFQSHRDNPMDWFSAAQTRELDIQDVSDMDSALGALAAGERFQLVLCCLDSDDLRALSNVQYLRERYPEVLIIAFFDVGPDMKEVTRTIHGLIANLREHAAQRSTIGASNPPRTPDIRHSLSPPRANHSRNDASSQLTPRQMDVLRVLTEGKSNKAIARQLDLCEGTVKAHCMAIFRTLGVTNRTQAAIAASKLLGMRRPEAAGELNQRQAC